MDTSTETDLKPDIDRDEYYTPEWVIEKARSVMGKIDCDPASCFAANYTVKADVHYSKQQNGLVQVWGGNVWLNPPYSQPAMREFISKALTEFGVGNVKQMCILTNSATETAWAQALFRHCNAKCFLNSRLNFYHPELGGITNGNRNAQILWYFGTRDGAQKFCRVFDENGHCIMVNKVP